MDFLELNCFLKACLLPSICSRFEGFERALDLTIVCSASPGFLCLMSFDFPIFYTLHFKYDHLLFVFNDGDFDTTKGISAGFGLARL